MSSITDAYMQEMLGKTRPYTVIILHKTPRYYEPGTDKIVWEHGRRNFQLRKDGELAIVCPIRDDSDVCGICLFTTSLEETRRIYDDDPGVKAGIFKYEIHVARSFPGDNLPM
jgi:hypothetical protein